MAIRTIAAPAGSDALRMADGDLAAGMIIGAPGLFSVNLGFVLERIAPSLDGFTFDRNDCRSMFDPLICFKTTGD